MNVKRIFWKLWFGKPAWSPGVWFAIFKDDDQIDGILCAGVTLFGVSLIYSDQW